MIYIIIPVFNRLDFTIKCLESLEKQNDKDVKIIVVNDGSTDGTSEYLREFFPSITVLEGNGNLWWTGATNLGVRKALQLSSSSHDYILTLNNDLVVNADYIESLVALAKSNPQSLIGSVSVDINNTDHIHYAGTIWNSKTAKYRPFLCESVSYSNFKSQFDYVVTDLLPGRGVLIPIDVFHRIGLYDAVNFPHYMSDEDFSARAKRAGFRLIISTKAVVMSHVNDTALKKRTKNITYYYDFFMSIKSPSSIKNRWNWAKKHSSIGLFFYFILDLSRIIKGLIINKN